MATQIDLNAIILAMIPVVGSIVAAYVTAKYNTRHVKASDEARSFEIDRGLKRGTISQAEDVSETTLAYRTSTRKLILRFGGCLLIAFFAALIGSQADDAGNTTLENTMFWLFCFSFIGMAIFIFRLVYRAFWVAFIK